MILPRFLHFSHGPDIPCVQGVSKNVGKLKIPKMILKQYFSNPILSLRLVNELLIKKKNLIQTTYFEENANIIFTYLSIARDIIRLFNQ